MVQGTAGSVGGGGAEFSRLRRGFGLWWAGFFFLVGAVGVSVALRAPRSDPGMMAVGAVSLGVAAILAAVTLRRRPGLLRITTGGVEGVTIDDFREPDGSRIDPIRWCQLKGIPPERCETLPQTMTVRWAEVERGYSHHHGYDSPDQEFSAPALSLRLRNGDTLEFETVGILDFQAFAREVEARLAAHGVPLVEGVPEPPPDRR